MSDVERSLRVQLSAMTNRAEKCEAREERLVSVARKLQHALEILEWTDHRYRAKDGGSSCHYCGFTQSRGHGAGCHMETLLREKIDP